MNHTTSRTGSRTGNQRISVVLSPASGLGFDLTEETLAKYPFSGTRPMARVFHEDGSVAEW
jgi:hypothetical protein